MFLCFFVMIACLVVSSDHQILWKYQCFFTNICIWIICLYFYKFCI